MPKPARGHHYISRFYLAGFASPSLNAQRLWQWDLRRHLVVPASPKAVGKERDFNLHANRNFPPDAIESALSELEARAAVAFEHIKKTSLPIPVENLDLVLAMASLFAVRNPGWRRFLPRLIEANLSRQLNKALDSAEKRQRLAQEMSLAGKNFTANEIEIAHQAYREGRLEFSMSRNMLIAREFENVTRLEKMLRQRVWTLVEPVDQDACFISSDAPVALGSIWGGLRRPLLTWVGWGREDTTVTFPLNPRQALVGSFEGNTMTAKVQLRAVADINTRTLDNARRSIFTSDKKFPVLDGRGEIQTFPPNRPKFTFSH